MILANFQEGIEIEDKQDPSDAFDKLGAGLLSLKNICMVAVEEVIDSTETKSLMGRSNGRVRSCQQHRIG